MILNFFLRLLASAAVHGTHVAQSLVLCESWFSCLLICGSEWLSPAFLFGLTVLPVGYDDYFSLFWSFFYDGDAFVVARMLEAEGKSPMFYEIDLELTDYCGACVFCYKEQVIPIVERYRDEDVEEWADRMFREAEEEYERQRRKAVEDDRNE